MSESDVNPQQSTECNTPSATSACAQLRTRTSVIVAPIAASSKRPIYEFSGGERKEMGPAWHEKVMGVDRELSGLNPYAKKEKLQRFLDHLRGEARRITDHTCRCILEKASTWDRVFFTRYIDERVESDFMSRGLHYASWISHRSWTLSLLWHHYKSDRYVTSAEDLIVLESAIQSLDLAMGARVLAETSPPTNPESSIHSDPLALYAKRSKTCCDALQAFLKQIAKLTKRKGAASPATTHTTPAASLRGEAISPAHVQIQDRLCLDARTCLGQTDGLPPAESLDLTWTVAPAFELCVTASVSWVQAREESYHATLTFQCGASGISSIEPLMIKTHSRGHRCFCRGCGRLVSQVYLHATDVLGAITPDDTVTTSFKCEACTPQRTATNDGGSSVFDTHTVQSPASSESFAKEQEYVES